jgi:hypothetical protein
MKTFSPIPFFLCAMMLALGFPYLCSAQRFNHSSPGGGGHAPAPRMESAPSRPAPQPAASRPAPAMNRPVEQPMARPTINGGGQNIGNHNYNRTVDAPERRGPPAEPVHENVPVNQNAHETVKVHQNVSVHENVNIYHAHGEPAYHAYSYHPYHPYYWGHYWHPVGFFAASIAADAFYFSLANQRYYYDQGVYYEPSGSGYAVVPAPVGAIVNYLPPGYETTMAGDDTYYYYGGSFYISNGDGYQVVPAPVGAVVTQIPDGATEQQINGESYLLYNNTYYQPVSQDGQDAYEVVQVN